MAAEILRAGVAAPVAEEAGQRFDAAYLEFPAEDVAINTHSTSLAPARMAGQGTMGA